MCSGPMWRSPSASASRNDSSSARFAPKSNRTWRERRRRPPSAPGPNDSSTDQRTRRGRCRSSRAPGVEPSAGAASAAARRPAGSMRGAGGDHRRVREAEQQVLGPDTLASERGRLIPGATRTSRAALVNRSNISAAFASAAVPVLLSTAWRLTPSPSRSAASSGRVARVLHRQPSSDSSSARATPRRLARPPDRDCRRAGAL